MAPRDAAQIPEGHLMSQATDRKPGQDETMDRDLKTWARLVETEPVPDRLLDLAMQLRQALAQARARPLRS